MHIESNAHNGTLSIRLNGELDLVAAEKFKTEIDKLLMQFGPKLLVINLEAVPFIDSSGLGAILGRYKKITEVGGKVILTSVKAPVRRILELSGFHKIMEISSDEKDFNFMEGQG